MRDGGDAEIPDTTPTEMSVSARVVLSEAQGALLLTVGIVPDPRVKPYDIQLSVAAEFSVRGATEEQFSFFLKNNAPAIVFPYIRQLTDQMTADGRYGRVRLDPVNLQGLLNQDAWSEEPPLASVAG